MVIGIILCFFRKMSSSQKPQEPGAGLRRYKVKIYEPDDYDNTCYDISVDATSHCDAVRRLINHSEVYEMESGGWNQLCSCNQIACTECGGDHGRSYD